jgi:beta-lactamase class A
MYAAALLIGLVLAGPPASGLEARLAPLVAAHKGRVAIAVKKLDTGEVYYLNADEVKPTASLIKYSILLEVYRQVDEEKLRLKDMITLHTSDKVSGSGILREHFSDGATFPLQDAVRLMIAFSDNTATNMVLERVGIAAVNQRMAKWGYPNTRVHALSHKADTTSIDPERSRRYGLGSTTAREMIGLFEDLERGKYLRPALKQAILNHLRKNRDKDRFKRLLPEDAIIAHKDGATETVRTDAGILYTPTGPVVLCVLTAENEDRRWHSDNAGNLLCARIALEVYNYYDPSPAPQARPR